jgi:hypothetical protein
LLDDVGNAGLQALLALPLDPDSASGVLPFETIPTNADVLYRSPPVRVKVAAVEVVDIVLGCRGVFQVPYSKLTHAVFVALIASAAASALTWSAACLSILRMCSRIQCSHRAAGLLRIGICAKVCTL